MHKSFCFALSQQTRAQQQEDTCHSPAHSVWWELPPERRAAQCLCWTPMELPVPQGALLPLPLTRCCCPHQQHSLGHRVMFHRAGQDSVSSQQSCCLRFLPVFQCLHLQPQSSSTREGHLKPQVATTHGAQKQKASHLSWTQLETPTPALSRPPRHGLQ